MKKIIKNIVNAYTSLFDSLKRNKNYRKKYRIKPKIDFYCTPEIFVFSLIPMIEWQPWVYRYRHSNVVSIWWFNFCIGFGEWTEVIK